MINNLYMSCKEATDTSGENDTPEVKVFISVSLSCENNTGRCVLKHKVFRDDVRAVNQEVGATFDVPGMNMAMLVTLSREWIKSVLLTSPDTLFTQSRLCMQSNGFVDNWV